MQCAIKWQSVTREEWQNLLRQCAQTTILQAYYYAQAMRTVKQQGVRHGIITIDGDPAGIVQMQEIALCGKMIHVLSVDRGPLWFEGYGTGEHLVAFTIEMNRQFPRRLGRRRRFLFEYCGTATLPLSRHAQFQPYRTFLLDIDKKTDILRKNLDRRWRNHLSKAEKSEISADYDKNLSYLPYFLQKYAHDRLQKGYFGASAAFLSALAHAAAASEECILIHARQGNKIIAGILIFVHGRCATYQAGWTSMTGRSVSAHHLLLWHAISILQEKGVSTFDLGGHNDDSEGLTQFKKGMGGREIALIGSYG